MKTARNIIILGLILTSAGVYAQRPGEIELGLCLKDILGATATFGNIYTTTMQLSGVNVGVSLEAVDDLIISFDCGTFKLRRDPVTKVLMVSVRNGSVFSEFRRAKHSEITRLAGTLAADPVWALNHVRQEIGKYIITLESNGELSMNRADEVLLSDPEEKVYGIYGERLIMDPQSGQIREFGILMKDGEGRTLIDVVYTYEKQSDGVTWNVTEYAYEKLLAGKQHTVVH